MSGAGRQQAGQALTVLNLGSHWKAIQVSEAGQITLSWTTLSGELLHADHDSNDSGERGPRRAPDAIDLNWCRRGMGRHDMTDFSRTLFETRLWEVRAAQSVSPTQRLSFLIGAMIEEAWAAFRQAEIW